MEEGSQTHNRSEATYNYEGNLVSAKLSQLNLMQRIHLYVLRNYTQDMGKNTEENHCSGHGK